MKLEKSCGSIVLNNNQVLLVKHNAGHWDFPKGHVEEGETLEETAIREVKEETNVLIEVISNYRYVTRYSPKENVLKDVIYFLGKPLSNDLKNQEEEVSEVKFVDIDQALSLITYDNSKKILKKLLQDLKKDN